MPKRGHIGPRQIVLKHQNDINTICAYPNVAVAAAQWNRPDQVQEPPRTNYGQYPSGPVENSQDNLHQT